MASFRKVNFEMKRGNGYGQYVIEGNYKKKNIKVHSTCSQSFDWLNDDSNKEKHNDARKYCYYKIVNTYNNI